MEENELKEEEKLRKKAIEIEKGFDNLKVAMSYLMDELNSDETDCVAIKKWLADAEMWSDDLSTHIKKVGVLADKLKIAKTIAKL